MLQYDAVRYDFILLLLYFAEGCLFYRVFLQNIVSFIGLFEEERGGSFCKKEPPLSSSKRKREEQDLVKL